MKNRKPSYLRQPDYLLQWSMMLIFILSSVGAGAQIQSDSSRKNTDSVKSLPAITIFHSVYKEVIPSQKLDGEELKSLNAFSVADAIRYFAGVQVKDYGGIGGLKTVDMRSMGTNHMGVFYDGIQLGNAQNGQIDLGKFSMDNIESISLYNGQKKRDFPTCPRLWLIGHHLLAQPKTGLRSGYNNTSQKRF